MTFLNIMIVAIFVVLVIFSVLSIRIFLSLGKSLTPPPAEIDVSMNDINNFIRKEFLYEFSKWILKSSNSVELSGIEARSSFINELKNPSLLTQNISNITALIVSKMSVHLKRKFYAVYKKEEDDSTLYEYVSRHVMFYMRKANVEITDMFETLTNIKTSDLIKQYALNTEREIYKINNIDIWYNDNKEENTN